MIDNIYYYTGIIFWWFCFGYAITAFIFCLWRYLSITFILWRTVIKAQGKYPDSGTVKDEFIDRRFWKLRLLIHFLNPQVALQCNSTEEISSLVYRVEFNHLIPKGIVYDKD